MNYGTIYKPIILVYFASSISQLSVNNFVGIRAIISLFWRRPRAMQVNGTPGDAWDGRIKIKLHCPVRRR